MRRRVRSSINVGLHGSTIQRRTTARRSRNTHGNIVSGRDSRTDKRPIVKFFSVLLFVIIFLLFSPTTLDNPRGAPGDSHSLDDMSSAALLTNPYGQSDFMANLMWNWEIEQTGESKSSFTAVIRSGDSLRGSLVLGGPLAGSVKDCRRNGELMRLSQGIPGDLGFKWPSNTKIEFEGRDPESIKRLDFQSDASGTVIRCDVIDFSSDDPPLHRVYTPTLLAYAHGATAEDLRANRVCVNATYATNLTPREQCAEMFNPVSYLPGQQELVSITSEQHIRDRQLMILGAFIGVVASTIFEAMPAVFTNLLRLFRRLSNKRGR